MHRILTSRRIHLWSIRRINNNSTGGIKPKPIRDKYYILGLAATILPGVIFGVYVAKRLAQFLEDSEIFFPGDDNTYDD